VKRSVLALALLIPALAQPLPEALKKAPEATGVVTARLTYETRKKELQRTLQDPLRTTLAELQARQALALAEARFKRALAQAENEIVATYTQALEALLQERIAERALAVAELALRAAQIRYQGGGATQLDVLEAENRLLEAQKNLDLARRGRESALASLASLVGDWTPEPVQTLPPLPEEALVETLLQEHADLLELRQSLELLRFQRGLLDESFTSRKDIESLEDQIKTLEENLSGLESSLEVGLRARYRQLAPLLQGAKAAEEAYQTAKERYQAAQKRYEAGLISRLSLLQQELNLLQAELALEQAKHAYLKAYYGLLATR